MSQRQTGNQKKKKLKDLKRKIREQEENTQKEDIEQTQPETIPTTPQKEKKPRKPSGKIEFLKILNVSVLDVVAALYKQTLTKQQKQDIIKGKLLKVDVVSKIALEGDWNCLEEEDAILFKHLLDSFGISLRNDRELSQERKKIVEIIKEFITEFVSSHDVAKLSEEFTKIGLNINNKDIIEVFETYKQYRKDGHMMEKCIDFTIKKQVLSSLIPAFRNQKNKTEMQLTIQFPLFEFTTLFENCLGGSLADNFKIIVPDFHPNDFTFVKYGDHECIKLIREDSPDSYRHHTLHKDFIPLIAEMQLCLAFNMRELLRDPVEDWQEHCVLGVTGEPLKCNVYLLSCQPIVTGVETKLFYNLSYIGSFKHYNLDHRIELVSLVISNLCYPNIESIVEMVTTKTPTYLKSPKKKIVVDFPTSLEINCLLYNVKYQEMDTKKEKFKNIRYCKINNIDCVVKRGNEGDKCNCLSLIIHKSDYFTVSLKGECLADFLHAKSEIDEESLFFDILYMLAELRSNRTTHNDIKPENIVKFNNHWFLIDFETCTQFDTFDKNRKCCLTQYSLLTCDSFSEGYRSPERMEPFKFNQQLFKGMVSPQSDIYSFGLVMLEVLKKKRIRGMENRSIVDQELKDLETKNEIIKELNQVQ